MKMYAIALGAMLVFGGILAFLPYAEAIPVHGKNVAPLNALPGVDRLLTQTVAVSFGGGPLTIQMWGVWYCPTNIVSCQISQTTSAQCQTDFLAGTQAGHKKYILRLTADGTLATGTQTDVGLITVDPAFGNGGTHTMTISANGAVPGGTVEWVELTQGAGTDQTDLAGLYLYGNCSQQGGSADTATKTFFVEFPVGGEILPINTSALLLAGLTTNALWILPALAVAAGAGIVVLKFQLNRKTI